MGRFCAVLVLFLCTFQLLDCVFILSALGQKTAVKFRKGAKQRQTMENVLEGKCAL